MPFRDGPLTPCRARHPNFLSIAIALGLGWSMTNSPYRSSHMGNRRETDPAFFGALGPQNPNPNPGSYSWFLRMARQPAKSSSAALNSARPHYPVILDHQPTFSRVSRAGWSPFYICHLQQFETLASEVYFIVLPGPWGIISQTMISSFESTSAVLRPDSSLSTARRIRLLKCDRRYSAISL